MRALVTGASGFVGRHLIDHLEAQGDEVIATDRHTGVDILDDAAVRKAMGGARPDVIYHLAGWSDVGGSWSDPMEVFRVNAEGTLRVLQAASEHGVARVLLDQQRRRVRAGSRDDELPAQRGLAASTGEPVRREQGGGRSSRPPGVARTPARRGPGAGVQPPRARTDRSLRRRRACRPSRPERVGRQSDRRRRQPVGQAGLHRRARRRPGLPAAGRTRRAGRGVQRRFGFGGRRVGHRRATRRHGVKIPMRLEVDPALYRPVDVPVLARRQHEAHRRHRLATDDPARHHAGRHARRRPQAGPTRARDRPETGASS